MKSVFVLEGIVQRGKQLGRELGFPTANLPLPAERPKDGVYAARVSVNGGAPINAILNQGCHPTFAEGVSTVEIHLLDEKRDLYGAHLRVEYVEFLRPEMTFADGEALSRQIGQDVRRAKEILIEMPADFNGYE